MKALKTVDIPYVSATTRDVDDRDKEALDNLLSLSMSAQSRPEKRKLNTADHEDPAKRLAVEEEQTDLYAPSPAPSLQDPIDPDAPWIDEEAEFAEVDRRLGRI